MVNSETPGDPPAAKPAKKKKEKNPFPARFARYEGRYLPFPLGITAERMRKRGLWFEHERPGDHRFLATLFAANRRDEFKQLDQPPEYIEALLLQQAAFQYKSYAEKFEKSGDSYIIGSKRRPIGRMFVHWQGQHVHMVDIAFLPEHCGKGNGTVTLGGVVEEATRCGCSLSINVEIHNPARHLYARLGFHEVATEGVYTLMQHPGGRNPLSYGRDPKYYPPGT